MIQTIPNDTLYVVGTRGFPNIQGGIERHCEELYTRLASAGKNIVVFTRSPYTAAQPKRTQYKGVHLLRVWAPRLKHLEAFLHTFLCIFVAWVHGGRFVHVHAVGPGLLVPLAKILGFKTIFTHHGFDYDRQKWGTLAKLVLRLGELLSISYADAVFAVSEQLAVQLKAKYKRPVHVLRNSIDIAELESKANNDVILDKYQLNTGSYLMAVSRLVPEKGLHDLVDVLEPEEHWPTLVVVGDAEHSNKYTIELRSRGSDKIRFLGKLDHDETVALLRHARAFVLPSYHEGLPIALLEAMALGTPVVASDIPGNSEAVGSLECGLLFQTGNKNDLRVKLGQMLSFEQRRRHAITQSARERVGSHFSWEKNVSQFNAEISRLGIM